MTDLYTEIQSFATKLVRKSKELDLEKIQVILETLYKILDSYGDINFAWNKEILLGGDTYGIFANKVFDLAEYIVKGTGETELVLKNHIMIQIFRIPLTNSPTLYNLLSVAFYCGLAQVLRASDLPDGLIRAFNTLQVSNLSTFVSTERYKQIQEGITEAQRDCVIKGLIHCMR